MLCRRLFRLRDSVSTTTANDLWFVGCVIFSQTVGAGCCLKIMAGSATGNEKSVPKSGPKEHVLPPNGVSVGDPVGDSDGVSWRLHRRLQRGQLEIPLEIPLETPLETPTGSVGDFN